MSRCVALLRAVNVGGFGRLAMADLRAAAQQLGWREVETILQSGSLVFTASGADAELESGLEAELRRRHGLATFVMVRTAERWADLLRQNPFADMAASDPSRLVLAITKEASAGSGLAPWSGEERIAVVDGDAYVTYPNGIGRSKLTAAVLERRLGSPATGRNWTTAKRIATAAGC